MRSPRDLAGRMRYQRDRRKLDDGYVRESFTLPREQAREKAAEWLKRFPKEGYSTAVDTWQQLPDGRIEFTMKRLRSAD